MSRKVFLSFLGTGNYLECNYNDVKNCVYIQEALIKKYCLNWNKEDVIYIFLTKEAEDRHWLSLKQCLNNLTLQAQIIPVKNVPSGKSEDEIWQIFEIMFNCLENNDQIIYDITHSFRSLPMLGMTLINYAKFLKKIEVIGIYYGAFEVLGNAFTVKDIPVENRNAPIFNLTNFSVLQDWSVAADNFVNLGNPEKMVNILLQHSKRILKETKGKDKNAENLKFFANNLSKIVSYIYAARGLEIVSMKELQTLKELVEKIKLVDRYSAKPLIPLLNQVENKLKDFQQDSISNGFVAVKWCIEHNLIQQGITLLQEFIVTYIAVQLELDIKDRDLRTLISSALHILHKQLPESEWKVDKKSDKQLLKQILAESYINTFANAYKKLSEYRNNLNHGGFSKEKIELKKFKERLEQSYKEVLTLINKE